MKKIFNTPQMNISVFDVENIVTDSSAAPVVETAEEKASTALAGAGATTTITLTF